MGRDEVLIDRERKDAILDVDVATGKLNKTSAQAIKNGRDLKDNLADVNQNYKDGAINATQYAAALKLLGIEESRLEKIYKEIVGPEREFNLNVKALDTLLQIGKISIAQYNVELLKLIEAFRGKDSTDWRVLDVVNADWQRFESKVRTIADLFKEWVADGQLLQQTFKELGVIGNQTGPTAQTHLGRGLPTSQEMQTSVENSQASEDKFHRDQVAKFQADLYSGTGPRNGKEFKAASIEEATAYTKRWNEELAKNKAQWADMDKFGQQAIGHVEDAMVQMATTGKLSFSGMIKSIEADFARLAAHRLLMSLLGGAGGGYGSVLGTGASQAFQGLYGGAHADGGSYTVPGSGGPDSQNVVFRLTPGERVDFTPPGGPSSAAASSAAGGLEIHNHFDPRDLPGSLRGHYGRKVIHNTIRNRRGAGR
jgi:hypothetical protein